MYIKKGAISEADLACSSCFKHRLKAIRTQRAILLPRIENPFVKISLKILLTMIVPKISDYEICLISTISSIFIIIHNNSLITNKFAFR